jgi:hypothetical protein
MSNQLTKYWVQDGWWYHFRVHEGLYLAGELQDTSLDRLKVRYLEPMRALGVDWTRGPMHPNGTTTYRREGLPFRLRYSLPDGLAASQWYFQTGTYGPPVEGNTVEEAFLGAREGALVEFQYLLGAIRDMNLLGQ